MGFVTNNEYAVIDDSNYRPGMVGNGTVIFTCVLPDTANYGTVISVYVLPDMVCYGKGRSLTAETARFH